MRDSFYRNEALLECIGKFILTVWVCGFAFLAWQQVKNTEKCHARGLEYKSNMCLTPDGRLVKP